MKNFLRMTLAVLSLSFLIPAGCRRGTDTIGQRKTNATFQLRGRVVSVNKETDEVTVSHEAIPGFMEAMTMPYKIAVTGAADELHPGDVITARLVTDKDSDGEYHHARLDRIVIVGQAKPDYKPKKVYHVPEVGELVPNFKLTDQNGHPLQFLQFRGKALLITFIYTRCPLGDFCPKMSRNFAEIHNLLSADKTLYAKTDLLSISFDPAYDTPAVLKSYGGAYTGKYTKEQFDHWQFAAPTKSDLPKLEQYFNVGVTGQDATLTHSLSTILIDPQGKIAGWYPGNAWKPSEIVDRMRQVTRH